MSNGVIVNIPKAFNIKCQLSWYQKQCMHKETIKLHKIEAALLNHKYFKELFRIESLIRKY